MGPHHQMKEFGDVQCVEVRERMNSGEYNEHGQPNEEGLCDITFVTLHTYYISERE